jgi:hypothetical protein
VEELQRGQCGSFDSSVAGIVVVGQKCTLKILVSPNEPYHDNVLLSNVLGKAC